MAEWIESKRERDVRVIARMARLADETARYGLELPTDEESEDYFLLGILLSMRELFPIESDALDALNPEGEECNLEIVLEREAHRALSEVIASDVQIVTEKLELLGHRYSTPLDAQDMTPEDRRYYLETLQPTFMKYLRGVEFAEDFVRLSILDSTSKMMLASLRQAQYEMPGNIDHQGTTWTRWLQEGRITEDHNLYISVINLMNERIPSRAVSNWEEINEIMESVE